VFIWAILTNTKSVRNFSAFEKSVLKPDIVESFAQQLPFAMKDYNFESNDSQ